MIHMSSLGWITDQLSGKGFVSKETDSRKEPLIIDGDKSRLDSNGTKS